MTDTTTRARALIEAATPLPWIRPWAELTVRAPGNDDLFGRLVPSVHHPGSLRAQANIDLAVYATSRLPALLDVAEKSERLADAWFDWRSSPEMGAAAVTVAAEQARAALSKLRESE